MANSNGGRINFQVGYNVDQNSINQVKKSLQDLQNIKFSNFKQSFKGTTTQALKDFNQIKKVAGQVQAALDKAFNVNLNSLNSKTFMQDLNNMKGGIQGVYDTFAKAGTQGQIAFNNITRSVLTTNLQLKQTKSLVNSMGETMANTVKWGIASSIMNNFTNSVQQAFQYVKGLDSALTDIRIVTGDSTEEMSRFADQANRAAQVLGRSTMDYTKAALTFYQQGLSDQDVQARTEATLKAQNITGAGQQMADYLTAVWNGYKVANEEAELYVDKLAAVADSSASNMSQLAVAMSKVASVANSLGVPVDSLNAQIATIVATTRNAPQSVGNALKTIYSRINDISTGAQDAQISLGNYSKKMLEVGVSVLDANGHLRDTGDVIEQIGGKWQSLSREQQIYLARTMAGQRQYNNLIALFDNWSRYTDLVNVSLDSQGSLMEKNSRYLDSLAAHMEQFGAAGQRVKAALIDEDTLKGIVDFGTDIVNTFASLVESLGGGGAALANFGAMFASIFSGVISKQINNVIVNIQNAKANADILKNDITATKTFSESGINSEGTRVVTQKMQAMQQYYSVMDKESINAQKNLIDELGQLENQKEAIKSNINALQEYASNNQINFGQKWEEQSKQVEKITEHIGLLKDTTVDLGEVFNATLSSQDRQWKNLTDYVENFVEEYSKVDPTKAQEITKAFNEGSPNGSFVRLLGEALDDARNKAQEYTNTLQNSQQEQEKLNQQTKNLSTVIDQNNKKAEQLFNINAITRFATGLAQVGMAVNNVRNLFRIWQDNTLSTGEKILQTLTNIGFTVTSMVNVIKGLKTVSEALTIFSTKKLNEQRLQTIQLKKQTLQLTKQKILKQAQVEGLTQRGTGWVNSKGQFVKASDELKDLSNLASNQAKEIENLGESVTGTWTNGLKQIGSGIVSFIASPLGMATIAAVALGAAVYAAYKYWNKQADAAKRASQVAAQTKKQYEQVKQTYDDLKSSLEDYNSAQKAIEDMTKGTQQWADAIREANDNVLQLLNNYPQLAQYISTGQNGRLQISEAGQEAVLTAQQQAVLNAQIAASETARDSRNASVRADAAAIGHNSWYNVQNGDGTQSGGFASANDVLKVADALDELNISVGELNQEGLVSAAEEIANLAGISRQEAQAILGNSEELLQLKQTIQTNATASDLAYKALAGQGLSDNAFYKNADELTQDVMSTVVGQKLDKATADLQAQWEKKLTEGINIWSGASNEGVKEMLNSFNEAQNTNWKLASNAVRGTDINRSFAFVDEEGNQKVYTKQQIAATIAASEALKELGNSAKDAQQMLNGLKEVGDNNAQAIKNLISGRNLSSMSKGDIEGLNAKSSQMAAYFNKYFEQAGYESGKAFQEAFIQMQQGALEQLQHITDGYAKGVQIAFKTLDLSQAGYELQSQVIQTLNKAFVNGKGLDDAQDQIAKVLSSAIDAGKLQELMNQDFANMDLDELKETMLELGISTQAGDEALKKFLDTMKQLPELSAQDIYNNIHSIIDKKNGKTLEYNDQLNQEDYQKLVDAGVAVDGAFVRLTSGMYKFIGDAEDFYNKANQTSLQPFLDQIDRTREKINSIGDNFSYEDLSKKSYDQHGGAITQIDWSLLQQQVDALNVTNLISDQDVAKYNQMIKNEQRDLESLRAIQKQIQDNSDAISNYAQTAKKSYEEDLHSQQLTMAYSQQDIGQLRNMRNREDTPFDTLSAQQYAGAVLAASEAEGIEIDNVKTLVNLFEKQADSLDWINDNLDSNQEAMYDVAAAIQDTISGIESIQKSWKQTIKEGVLHPDLEVINETAQALSDMFNQDVDASFVQQHLEDIRALAQGDIDAVTRLGLELANLQINKIAVEAELDTSNFDWSVQSLQEQLANTDWGQIQIGTSIDEQPFYDALQNFIIASGATEQQINEILAGIGYQPEIEYKQIQLDDDKNSTSSGRYYYETEDLQGNIKRVYVDEELGNSLHSAGITTIPIIKGSKFAGGSRNLRNIGGSRVTPKAPSSSGGKKGGGGKGSTPKTTTIETKAAPQRTAKKQADYDPYEQVTKRYQRQQDIIDELQQKQKKLVNKDRLKNIEQQNKALEDQAKILQDRLAISQNAAEKNTTAWFAKELQTAFGKNVGFDADGRIANRNQTEQAAVNAYNKAVEKADKEYEKALAKYNANAGKALTDAQKKQIQNELKAAEDKKKKAIDIAKQQYDRKTQLLDNYEKAWQEDEKTREEIEELWQKIYENRIIESKIKVDLDIDSGDLERQWLEFENKVIKKIKKNDFVEQAKANAKQIASYFNSGQIESTKQQIDFIRKQIEIMESGGTSDTYGTDMAQAQKDLEQYMKQQMDDLEKIQDLVEEMQDNYLDAIDKARDKMDEQIDQYERVNKLIDHNVKLTQLLYGDKAYDTMDKYYEKQKQNNQEALQSLRAQQQYWQQRMDNETPGSEAWQKFKKNVDDATDNLNDKLEQMIQNLSNQWQNRVDGIIDKLNNALTGGRGLDYLDEQWDYINNYDDKFLDTVESKMGIQDVQSLYNSAIESVAGNPKAQQRINKLMNDQLKILKQKDKLTQYDLDRAKAMLQVEQARMDLEDARNNKTKMRLRRDSQGNYTYQYVADEGKLEDLQSALADAQNNLYNMDKEHYKQNLNDMYDTYKDYLDNMRSLTAEYQATQDEEERRRIKARMELLQESYSKLSEGLTQDNEYALRYLTESYFDAMGQNPADFSQEEQFNILKENVPQVASDIQTLTDNIVGAGGLLPATADAIKEITDAIEVYDEEVTGILETAGTSLDIISQVVDAEGDYLDNNITKAKELVTANEQLISSIDDEIAKVQELLNYVQQYLQGIMDIEEVLANLRDGYDEQQRLLDHEVTVAQEIAPTANELDTTLGRNVSTPEGRTASDVAAQLDYISMLNSNTQEQIKEGVVEGITEAGQLIDSVNIGEVQSVTPYNEYEIGQHIQQLKDTYESQINSLYNQIADLESRLTSYPGMVTNIQQLDQDVRITANFPNVNSSAEIEQAFYDLVNAAAQYSSRYKQSNSING